MRMLRAGGLVAALFLGLTGSLHADFITDTLGSSSGFALLGISNTSGSKPDIDGSLGTVNGNTGIGPNGTLNLMAPFTINGNVLADTTATITGPGKITGTTTRSTTTFSTDATNASATFASLTPTQTFANISSPTTITGNGGLNVINITGNIANSLTLKGTSSDQFVVNVQGTLNLTGSESLGCTFRQNPSVRRPDRAAA